MSLKVLFMGTPQFAVPTLDTLLRSRHQVVAVVTQPTRQAGRGRRPSPSPVRNRAEEARILVLDPPNVKTQEFHLEIQRLMPDIGVVVAYGQILPPEILKIPPLGFINVHASLLPRHRGAAPIAWAILTGDLVTGVTIIQMDEGMDTGPILSQRSTAIGEEEDALELSSRLSHMGAELLLETLDKLETGQISPQPQDPAAATYAPRLQKSQGAVDWTRPAVEIARMVRALVPWPAAYTRFKDGNLILWKAKPLDLEAQGIPGTIVRARGDSLWVATGQGTLEVTEVQPEGRPRMTAKAFIQGRRGLEGQILGSH